MAGRPKTPLPLRLRIVAWTGFVDMVIEQSRNPTDRTYLANAIKSGLWARYRRGEVVPAGAFSEGTNSLVTRIDTEVAVGSMSFVRHPFWDLLDFSRFMTPVELKTISRKLKKPVRGLFVAGWGAAANSKSSEKFWYRQPVTDGNGLIELRKHVSLDGLAACLICARMAYLAQDARACKYFYRVGLEIMAAYSERDLFSADRMKSVRLVIEYYFIGQMRWLNLLQTDFVKFGSGVPRSADKLLVDWRGRCRLHLKTLTVPEQKNLQDILMELREVEPSRMVG